MPSPCSDVLTATSLPVCHISNGSVIKSLIDILPVTTTQFTSVRNFSIEWGVSTRAFRTFFVNKLINTLCRSMWIVCDDVLPWFIVVDTTMKLYAFDIIHHFVIYMWECTEKKMDSVIRTTTGSMFLFKDIRWTIWNRSLAGRTSHGLSVQMQVSSQTAISTWKGILKLARYMVSTRRRHCFVSSVSYLERKGHCN